MTELFERPPSPPAQPSDPSANSSQALASPAQPRSGGKPFWSRTKVVVSVLVGAISVITGGVSVIPIFLKDPSNFSHLQIVAEPAGGDVREWALPAAALSNGYPVPGPGAPTCGAEQLRWLEANGVPVERRIHLNMRNRASEGPALALVDFRTTSAKPEQRGEPQVRVTCTASEQLPETVYYARLDADTGVSTARDVVLKRGDGEQQEQLSVAVNLRPGESQQRLFELFARYPANGQIEVTVLSGDAEQTVPIEGSEFTLPPLLFSGEMYLVTAADGLRCERVDGGSIQPCTMADVLHEAATAQQ